MQGFDSSGLLAGVGRRGECSGRRDAAKMVKCEERQRGSDRILHRVPLLDETSGGNKTAEACLSGILLGGGLCRTVNCQIGLTLAI